MTRTGGGSGRGSSAATAGSPPDQEDHAETFVGRIPFQATPRQLAGEATIGGTTFQVVLTRQGAAAGAGRQDPDGPPSGPTAPILKER